MPGAKRKHLESNVGAEEDSDGQESISDEVSLVFSGESSDTESEHSVPEAGSDTDDEDLHIFPKSKDIISNITGQSLRQYPEIEPDYDSDSSTEDDPNRIGNVPLHWYDDLPHIGYSVDGKQILRPAKGDELDKFLATMEDPNKWTSAFDEKLQMERPLTAEELDIIHRLQQGEIPDGAYDPYEPTVEWFTGKGKEEVMPLSAAPEPKRRWLPSKWEKQKVMKIVRAIRQGRILPSKPKTSSAVPQFFDLWGAEDKESSAIAPAPAPRRTLPTNAESYNPPPEYLPTEEERKAWEEADPEDREKDFLPQSFSALRRVPAYDRFVQEQFNRQLDLYLAPRIQKKRLNIDADSLIPKLPSPDTLRPFPLYRALRVQHTTRIRCAAVSPDGYWVVTGDDSGTVSLWEIAVGFPVKSWKFTSKATAMEWCPRKDCSFFVVAVEESLKAIIPPCLESSLLAATSEILFPSQLPPATGEPSPVKWQSSQGEGESLNLQLPPGSSTIKQVTFHRRGDYIATVCDGQGQVSVWIHQISKRHSQSPFKKIKGKVQKVLFHPTRPILFIATQRYVRMYDLVAQTLLKTLQPGIRWISSLDVHPLGDHLIVGGYDRKLCWFDLELSEKPYKIMRYHTKAIRAVMFHPKYPLFATCSDDGTIQVFHSRVYHDLMSDPLIVPLKILKGHGIADGLGVLDLRWCSHSPWLVSVGADGNALVWCS